MFSFGKKWRCVVLIRSSWILIMTMCSSLMSMLTAVTIFFFRRFLTIFNLLSRKSKCCFLPKSISFVLRGVAPLKDPFFFYVFRLFSCRLFIIKRHEAPILPVFFEVERILTLCRWSNFKVAVEEVIFLLQWRTPSILVRKDFFFGQSRMSSCHCFSSGKSEDSFLLFFLSKSVRSDLSIRKSSLKKFDCDIVVLKIQRMKRKIFEVEDNVLQQWRSWWNTWSTNNFSRK